MIADVGDALKSNFPYTSEDKNELDDNIVFGKWLSNCLPY